MIKEYGQDLRAKITKSKYCLGGVNLSVKFQKRIWWCLWNTIDRIEYHVYDYWTIGGMDFGPIRGEYRYGLEYECWKPEKFNLDKSLEERWLKIISEDETNKSIYEQFKNIV